MIKELSAPFSYGHIKRRLFDAFVIILFVFKSVHRFQSGYDLSFFSFCGKTCAILIGTDRFFGILSPENDIV